MKKNYWIFTFGVSQPHQNKYVKIWATDPMTARSIMFARYGDRWAFQYNDELEAGVENWKLERLTEIDETLWKNELFAFRNGKAIVEVKDEGGYWKYRHPLTGQWVENPRQILYGWREQDDDEQAEWNELVDWLETDAWKYVEAVGMPQVGEIIDIPNDEPINFL